MKEVQKKLKERGSEEVAEEEGDKEDYMKFFAGKLKKYGVKSPAELDDEKKKKFFNEIEKDWTHDSKEEVEVEKKEESLGKRVKARMKAEQEDDEVEDENPFKGDEEDEDEDPVGDADVVQGGEPSEEELEKLADLVVQKIKDKADEEEEEEEEEEEPEEEVKKEEVAPIPKTKNGMLKSVYEKLNSLKKDQLAAQYETILKATDLVTEDDEKEEDEEEKVESKRTKAAIKAEDLNIDVKDDVEALVQGEDGLTEEFKEKASTIFQAAVQAKVLEEVNKKADEIETQLKEDQDKSSEGFKKEMTEKVDGYLTYVVEEWMKENELAIEKGIRSELVEDFMSGLKTLFAEHYIDIPEEKVDMVDDLFTKVEDLETSLDEEINRGVELQKELAQFKKDDAISEVTKDLADTETEKISKLAEGIEYENQEQYIEKLNVLKESYFPKSDAVTSEITETDETIEVPDEKTEVKLHEDMEHYTSAIKRYNS